MKRFLFYFLAFFSILGYAQNPGDVAQTFGSTGGFDKSVRCTLVQSDGKIVIGGQFTSYHSSSAKGICRLNADGTVDASFNVGVGFSSGATVYSLALQSDGKIIVGGVFTSYKGVAANNIIRLNADGSIDASFDYGAGFIGGVNSIKIQSNGKILVGGLFTYYKVVSQNYLIRLNADGSKDTTFNVGTGFNGGIETIALQSDGKIIVGGQFTAYNSSASPMSIMRLNSDGTVDSSFITSGGFERVVGSSSYAGNVKAIELQTDGKILVGGVFDVYTANFTSVSAKRMVRLNADGTKDTSFDVANGFLITSTTPGTVNVIKLQSDGKIVVGGDFELYYTNFTTAKKIIRLNADGTKDTSFSFGNGFDNIVYSINTLSTGSFIVSGDFSTYGFSNRARKIARITSTGGFDSTFYKGDGISGYVNSVVVQQDNKIIVGGSFPTFQNNSQNNIIRFNVDGTKDVSFNIGTGFDNSISSLILQANGKVVVGGNFGSYNGASSNSIVRLNNDGTLDSSFNIGSGFNNNVGKLVLQPDGKIIVLGTFTSYNGVSSMHIVRLNSDGTKDNSFNAGSTGFNIAIGLTAVLQSDGKILVAGRFTQFNGVTENYIVRLNPDGTKDTSFVSGTGFDGLISQLIVKSNGKIIAVGQFTSYNGVTGKNYIIGLNSDGSVDASFNVGSGLNLDAASVFLQGDDKVLVGGRFSTFNGGSAKNIARINADGSLDSSFSTGVSFSNEGSFSPYVYDMNITPNGKIIAAGTFNIYQNTNYSTSLIALHGGVPPVMSSENYEVSKSFALWPNPVVDELNVESIDGLEILGVKIYDFQGKLVLESKNELVNMANLKSGIYLVNIISDKGSVTKRVIKK